MTIAESVMSVCARVRAAGGVWAGHCWAGIAREVWRAGRQQRRGCSLCPALPSLQLTLTLGTCLASLVTVAHDLRPIIHCPGSNPCPCIVP